MQSPLVFLLLVGSIISYSAAQNYLYTIPCLFWSNADFFLGLNTQVVELVSTKEVADIFDISKRPSSFPKYLPVANSQAEVLVVFLESQLRTDHFTNWSSAHNAVPNGGSFSSVKSLVETSKSSLVLPYVRAVPHISASSVLNEIVEVMLSRNPSTSIIISHYPYQNSIENDPLWISSEMGVNVNTLTWNKFLEQASNPKWSAYHNEVTDLIVVQFELNFDDSDLSLEKRSDPKEILASFADHDQAVAMLCHLFNQFTDRYVALLTSKQASDRVNMKISAIDEHLFGKFEEAFKQTLQSEDLFPVEIVQGLLLMIPLLIILGIGLWCIFGIQSGLHFGGEKTKKNE